LGTATALGDPGTTATAGGTVVNAGATLDLSGHDISESMNVLGTLINSSGTASSVNADMIQNDSFTADGSGDIALQRVQRTGATRTITKNGAGTLTLGTAGTTDNNNLMSLTVNGGTVLLNMPANLIGVDRGIIINDGTVRLTGSSTRQMQIDQSLSMNGGTF